MSGIVVLVDLDINENIAGKYYDDGGLNERIFQKRSLFQIALIAAVVAIGEEILFRGVIQTHMGLITIELIFALCITAIYLIGFICEYIGLSFLIGFIYLQTGNFWLLFLCTF